MNRHAIVLISLCALFASCAPILYPQERSREVYRQSMIQADRAASVLSKDSGFRKAIIASLDTSGVLLRPNHFPLKGTAAIAVLNNQSDSAFILTWEPQEAILAVSTDIGYTFGIYTLQNKRDGKVSKGTYVTIWRKYFDGQNKHHWKMLLDTGNPGVDK